MKADKRKTNKPTNTQGCQHNNNKQHACAPLHLPRDTANAGCSSCVFLAMPEPKCERVHAHRAIGHANNYETFIMCHRGATYDGCW